MVVADVEAYGRELLESVDAPVLVDVQHRVGEVLPLLNNERIYSVAVLRVVRVVVTLLVLAGEVFTDLGLDGHEHFRLVEKHCRLEASVRAVAAEVDLSVFGRGCYLKSAAEVLVDVLSPVRVGEVDSRDGNLVSAVGGVVSEHLKFRVRSVLLGDLIGERISLKIALFFKVFKILCLGGQYPVAEVRVAALLVVSGDVDVEFDNVLSAVFGEPRMRHAVVAGDKSEHS